MELLLLHSDDREIRRDKEQSNYSKPNINSGNLFLTRLRFDRDI